MSLDTKYRPKTYSDVLGQKGTIKTIQGFVKNGAGWKQSYLFAGPYGSGKTTLGRVLARALLCESPIDGDPCDRCDSCVTLLEGSSDAFVEVDAATNSGKNDIKQILEEINYASFSGRRKLYLFDEAHQLSPSALDALLKPMEENRPNSEEKRLVCIFATTEPEKMKATVLSRCAPAFIIHHVDSEEIADRLAFVCEQESISYDREALLLIADFSEGHIRDALKSIEGVASANNSEITLEGVRSYLHVDRNDKICDLLVCNQKEALRICEEILSATPVGVAYERLLSATMHSISIGYGAGDPPPYWNKDILTKAWEIHQEKLIDLAQNISSTPRKPTASMFKCELLKWKSNRVVVSTVAPVQEISEKITKKEKEIPLVEPARADKPIENKTLSLSRFVIMVKQFKHDLENEVVLEEKIKPMGRASSVQ